MKVEYNILIEDISMKLIYNFSEYLLDADNPPLPLIFNGTPGPTANQNF